MYYAWKAQPLPICDLGKLVGRWAVLYEPAVAWWVEGIVRVNPEFSSVRNSKPDYSFPTLPRITPFILDSRKIRRGESFGIHEIDIGDGLSFGERNKATSQIMYCVGNKRQLKKLHEKIRLEKEKTERRLQETREASHREYVKQYRNQYGCNPPESDVSFDDVQEELREPLARAGLATR